MQYWQDAMDKSYKNHFRDMSFNTPCCHKETTLNDLKYHSTAGFSRFSVLISDPTNEIKPGELAELEKILGTKLTSIMAHY